MCILVSSNNDQNQEVRLPFFQNICNNSLFSGYLINLLKIKRTTQVHGKHAKGPPRSYNQELMTSRKSNEKGSYILCLFKLKSMWAGLEDLMSRRLAL
jgi:hypothetical protein